MLYNFSVIFLLLFAVITLTFIAAILGMYLCLVYVSTKIPSNVLHHFGITGPTYYRPEEFKKMAKTSVRRWAILLVFVALLYVFGLYHLLT